MIGSIIRRLINRSVIWINIFRLSVVNVVSRKPVKAVVWKIFFVGLLPKN